MPTESQSEWPLVVAREEQISQALTVLDGGGQGRGVALVGDIGVGKSTLARSLANTLESRGLSALFVLGTEAGRAIPLGAFSRSVTVDVAYEPVVMLAAALRTLEQEENLVVVVDDAHLLDPLSASLVYQLASGGGARLIVTIRSGEVAPDAVTALWKERLVLRMDINALTHQQTEELARAVLGGAIDRQLIDELYRRTAGNLLLLRGLLSAGRASGVLVRTETGWQLHGRLHGDGELYDLLRFRLRSLAPEELEAVEVLAMGELLDWEILRGLCDAEAVANLERRGMIQLVADGTEAMAHLHHPILGEAAIELAGAVRSRQLNTILAQAFLKHLSAGGQRLRLPDVRGRIRLAHFMIHSDMPPDLDVIMDAAASAMTMSNTVSAEELARFAFDRGGGLSAALLLASVMSWQGRGDEAEAVLADFEPEDADARLVVQWGCLRAANLFFNCGQVQDAALLLARVKDGVDSPVVSDLVRALEMLFGFHSGEVKTAITVGPNLCAADVLPLATAWVAAPTAYALALVGRFDEAHRVADAGLRAVAVSEAGPQRFAIGLVDAVAAIATGDLREAEQIWERYAAMAAGMSAGAAIVDAIRGIVHLAQGALPSASAAFHGSISALSDGFPALWTMLVAAWCTQADGARGDSDAAAATLRISEEAYGPQVAVLLPELELARAWERASAGYPRAARTHAVRAAEAARQSGMLALEMRALHTVVRLGDGSFVGRLEELGTMLKTPLADAVARHAQGLAGRDGDLLDAVADRFVEMGALALAADAAAQAAAEHARGEQRGKEVESSTRAYRLASLCGLRTPATAATARPLPITDREHEIAALVAGGWSNRQIADRLVVSVRTIDGHLYRIFAKLGINNRDQLIHLLNPDPPQDQGDSSGVRGAGPDTRLPLL